MARGLVHYSKEGLLCVNAGFDVVHHVLFVFIPHQCNVALCWISQDVRSVPHDKTIFLATESDLKTGAFSLTGTEAPFLLHFFTLKLAKKG